MGGADHGACPVSVAALMLNVMLTRCPDNRLDYIVEGVKFEGAIVKYEVVEGDDSGWVLHVFDPKVPSTAMFTYSVPEADVNDGTSRARLRSRLDSHWQMCFMN